MLFWLDGKKQREEMQKRCRKDLVVATSDELNIPQAKEAARDRVVIVTGVGGTNTIRALRDLPKDADILNIGYCGSWHHAIGTSLRIGMCRTFHKNCTFVEPTFHLDGGCVLCLTAGDFVKDSEIPKDAVVDMELAYIAALGFTNLSSIKVVSDNLNYEQYEATIAK